MWWIVNAQMFLAGRTQFGPGVASKVGEIAKSLRAERAVLVTDGNMERLGVTDRMEKLLQEAGVECCVFAGVEPEPSVETTDAVAELAREHDCQLVVGLGGGSCLDVAKTVSVLITNMGSAAQYQGMNLVKERGVPRILIPTTAGTGSEVTSTAVLMRKSDGFKGGINDEKLFSDYNLLDPELTLTMPPDVTAATGMDALTHALEAYTGRSASVFSDIFAEEALRRIGRHLRVATWNGRDLNARSEMLLASYFAGVALTNSGVGACHSLAYPLGSMFGVGHGMANALLVPYVSAYNALAAPEKYAAAATLLGFGSEGLPLRDQAFVCAEGLDELVEDLGLPRKFKELKKRKLIKEEILAEQLPDMAAKAMAVVRSMENNPRPMTVDNCVALYREAME